MVVKLCKKLGIRAVLAFCFAHGVLVSSARADDDLALFYKGRTISLIIGSAPGGGYDLYGRLIARYIGKHIPGNPVVVPSNMPGAASNVAAAYVYNVAPKDGTVMGALYMGSVVDPLFSDQRPTHDPTQFNYIGNANADVYVCLVRADAQVKTFEDLFTHELIVGGSAIGASTHDFPALLNAVLGTKFKIVAGYPGTREISFAIDKNEVQGGCGNTWSSISSSQRDWFSSGKVKVLAQEDAKGYPELNAQKIPRTLDFAKTDEQRQMLELYYSQSAFGRPYVMAPHVDQDKIKAMRTAFMATMNDPDLKAEAEKIKVDVIPIAGDVLQELVKKIYATSPDIVDKVRRALAAK
jgi:tripartite-type tricarboxylate transporter receptor subunit TctC